MTYLELCQKVREECGVQGSGPSSVIDQTGLLKRFVNWVASANLLVQALHPDWNFLWKEFTADTTLGSFSITKPADLGMWYRGSFAVDRWTSSGRSLQLISYEVWRSNNYLKINSEPYSLAISPSNDLVLSSPANGTFEIYGEYWKTPEELTSNTQVSLIPERFHRVIIERAKSWFFEDIESFEQMDFANREYEKQLIKLENYSLPGQQEASQSSPEPIMVRAL